MTVRESTSKHEVEFLWRGKTLSVPQSLPLAFRTIPCSEALVSEPQMTVEVTGRQREL